MWRLWHHRWSGWLWAKVVDSSSLLPCSYPSIHWYPVRKPLSVTFSANKAPSLEILFMFTMSYSLSHLLLFVVFVQLLNVFKKVPGFKEIRVLGFRWEKSIFLISFSSVIGTAGKHWLCTSILHNVETFTVTSLWTFGFGSVSVIYRLSVWD